MISIHSLANVEYFESSYFLFEKSAIYHFEIYNKFEWILNNNVSSDRIDIKHVEFWTVLFLQENIPSGKQDIETGYDSSSGHYFAKHDIIAKIFFFFVIHTEYKRGKVYFYRFYFHNI